MNTDDLALVFNPPAGSTVRFGSGKVISWNSEEFANRIDFNGSPIDNFSVFGGVNALTIQQDDAVALLGYESPGGVSTWFVLGRIISPGDEASDLVILGGSIILERGSVEVRDGGTLSAAYPSGTVAAKFGPLILEETGLPDGHGLLIQADGEPFGRDVFRAKYVNGERIVLIGYTPAPEGAVESFQSWAQNSLHHAYSSMRLQSHDDADIEILSDERLRLYGDDTVDIDCPNGTITADAGADLVMLADADAAFGGATGTFLQPEAGAGNAEVRMNTSDGRITYVSISSTRRVKRDIQDLDVDTSAVLRMRPRTWLPQPAVTQCPDWMHEKHTDPSECRSGETIESPEDEIRQPGFIAEELDEIGLGAFVKYDGEGLPAAIHYDRLTAAMVPLLQQQQQQIDALSARLDALEINRETPNA